MRWLGDMTASGRWTSDAGRRAERMTPDWRRRACPPPFPHQRERQQPEFAGIMNHSAWLRSTSTPSSRSAPIADKLTMIGLEVESVTDRGKLLRRSPSPR